MVWSLATLITSLFLGGVHLGLANPDYGRHEDTSYYRDPQQNPSVHPPGWKHPSLGHQNTVPHAGTHPLEKHLTNEEVLKWAINQNRNAMVNKSDDEKLEHVRKMLGLSLHQFSYYGAHMGKSEEGDPYLNMQQFWAGTVKRESVLALQDVKARKAGTGDAILRAAGPIFAHALSAYALYKFFPTPMKMMDVLGYKTSIDIGTEAVASSEDIFRQGREIKKMEKRFEAVFKSIRHHTNPQVHRELDKIVTNLFSAARQNDIPAVVYGANAWKQKIKHMAYGRRYRKRQIRRYRPRYRKRYRRRYRRRY